jgi:hypothetical protein
VASGSILLTRPEAIQVLSTSEGALEVLRDTDFLVIVLELEDVSYLMIDRLFPEERP